MTREEMSAIMALHKDCNISEKKCRVGEEPLTECPRFGVHEAHCCNRHGCKYGDEDCPVVSDLIKQEYPCEDCDEDLEQFQYLLKIMTVPPEKLKGDSVDREFPFYD